MIWSVRAETQGDLRTEGRSEGGEFRYGPATASTRFLRFLRFLRCLTIPTVTSTALVVWYSRCYSLTVCAHTVYLLLIVNTLFLHEEYIIS